MSTEVLNPATLAKLNEIQACLKVEKNVGVHVKADIYSHLMEVLTRILQYHPFDGFDRFEEISTLIKSTNQRLSNASKDSELNGSITVKQALEWITKAKQLIDELPDTSMTKGDRALLSSGPTCIPNLKE